MLDGRPIRAVLTTHSGNRKTGDMAQLWILVDAEAPHLAQKSGADASVCGDCPFRPLNGGGCYVVTFQGPLSVWRSTNGRAVNAWGALRFLQTRIRANGERATLRLGAYGDPAALPTRLIARLSRAVDGRTTGYSHQWRQPHASGLKPYVMASVESTRDALIAHSQGWRTFRVTPNDATLLPAEIVCLAESKGRSCRECGLCDGDGPAKSVAVPAHGFAVRKASAAVA